MEDYDVWKFLHIASMFTAVSIFVGQGMLTGVVARGGDVRALRRVLAAGDRFGPIGGGLFLLGIVSGFVTAIVESSISRRLGLSSATYSRCSSS